MKRLLIIILFFCTAPMIGQSKYERLCNELKITSFHEEFDQAVIEKTSNELIDYMTTMTEDEFVSCNCADTLWISLLRDKRRFLSYSHSIDIDTNVFLRMLPSRFDIANLRHELRFARLKTLQDSLNFVLSRAKYKDEKRYSPEYNWRNFYHCIEAELEFLKENKYELESEYFRIFDDTTINYELRDMILLSLFNSNESIEDEILIRIDNYIGHRFLYRMLGVLRACGTEKSVNHFINMIRINDIGINDKKMILRTIYDIMDKRGISRKSRKRFRKYLIESQLDTLSRYDLYIRG